MSDTPPDSSEPKPPPREFRFKLREFERANPMPLSSDVPLPAPDPGIQVAGPEKIDVQDMIRAGAGPGLAPGSNAAANRENEIHGILRDNLKHDIAAGHFDLGVLDDSKRLRRIRHYWIAMVAVNGPLGAFAGWVGHTMALPFVGALAGMAMFSATLTWKTFFLRTNY